MPTNRSQVPVLPLRDTVVFPHMVSPFVVGREKSLDAIAAAQANDGTILVVTQRDPKINDPTRLDVHDVGCLCGVVRLVRLPNGTGKVLLEGRHRVSIDQMEPSAGHLVARVRELEDESPSGPELEALMRTVHEAFDLYAEINRKIDAEFARTVGAIESPSKLSDVLASQLDLKLDIKQELLAETNPSRRLEQLVVLLQGEAEILKVKKRVRSRLRDQLERTQREYYLNEQMQAIQKELGGKDEYRQEVDELEKALEAKNMPEDVRGRCARELRKLKMMQPMSAEATVVRNYIDWVLDLPWDDLADENRDLTDAASILDEDHFGLRKVKERIIEYLAVRMLVKEQKGPILCLVGPPGVGKTSLARSIARSTHRDFVRISLGGVRDEAEIRGHRRTYIGAMPGKIIKGLRRAGASNPVFLLDEVDKLASDWRGDPASALLEVLDPEQNDSFQDHYLDLDYDLSRILFVCTANTVEGIPPALMDRLELIRLPGYTEPEKMAIARRYLVGKQLDANGLTEEDLVILDSGLRHLIRRYTREAGVRQLERSLSAIARKVARLVVQKGPGVGLRVGEKGVEKVLGTPPFRYGVVEEEDPVGAVNGLAWTQVGGEILPTEATAMPGKGKLILTGQLGDVMQESAQAALTCVRSRCSELGLDKDFYASVDLHVHVPEAIPKDGPSAGITMATAMASTLLGVPVKRDFAMTGEITLRGKVLPIGGLKEKLLAAQRAGIREVILPAENEKDLKEVPATVREDMTLHLVSRFEEVLKLALVATKK